VSRQPWEAGGIFYLNQRKQQGETMPKRTVTRTGRAISPGRVTRASLSTKRPSGRYNKPLPFSSQCHPKALSPTSRNPDCFTYVPQDGLSHQMAMLFTRNDFLRGLGLSKEGKYSLIHIRFDRIVGYTDDITLAIAFRDAAKRQAIYFDVVEQ
jgi:hypothetical protein